MKRRRQRKKHRFFAALLCFCMLFTMPGIQNVFPVIAAGQEESFRQESIITAFDPLSEEVKEQTVFTGTDRCELDLPEELTVYLLRKSSEQKAEESEQENIGETNDIEKNSDTETRDEQPEDDGESAEKTDETDTEDEEGGTGESVPVEEQGKSETEQESMPSEEQQESAPAQETHTVTMQEYLAENVIPVQTLEDTQTEKQEETVTIDGVTWQSEPEYDGSMEGTYTFTAVLPDGYTLAEGVSLPEIMVTVESGIDAIIQTLRDRIAALPDAEEYLALEPNMEDEDAYAEWEEKLYVYAEETLAIWEEYEALTEEQKAQMSEEELIKLTAWVEIAETLAESSQVMAADGVSHTHCFCGGNINAGDHTNTDHTNDFAYNKILTSNASNKLLIDGIVKENYTLTSGSYYLGDDVTLNSELIIEDNSTVYICLNGKKLENINTTGCVICVGKGSTFTLCDCDNSEKGCIREGKGHTDTDGKFRGGAIYMYSKATFNMFGGVIIQNEAENGGGGIYSAGNADEFCTFNMYGGEIINNSTKGQGGGILTLKTHIKIFGGNIEENTAGTQGGGIYVDGDITISDASIINNKANQLGGGLCSGLNAVLSISGAVDISGNTGKNGAVDNVFLRNNVLINVISNLEGSSIGVNVQMSPTPTKPAPVQVAGGKEYGITAAEWSCFFSDKDGYEILWKETTDNSGKSLNELWLALPGSCDLGGFDLSASGATLSPSFDPDTTRYTSTVANSVDEVGITATLADTAAGADITIKINDGTAEEMGNGVPKTVNLVEGKNTIAVTVTSGGVSKIYTIEITREEAPTGFTVTLNGNGGSAGTNVTSYVPGTKVTLPIDWTKTGYEFAGWYDNENCTGTEVKEISATATGDKEYWAGWTPNTYQVTFDYHGADDGNTTASKNVAYDSKYGALPMPSKRGYTFKGWYTEADGQGSEVDADTVVTKTSDHALHAWWKDETPPNKPVLQDGVTLPADWTNAQNKIPLKLYDGVGVTGLMVSVDGSPFAEVNGFPGGTGSVLYDYAPVPEGEHTYQFKTKDAAGNISAASDIFTVRLDKKKPVIGTLTYENKAKDFLNWIIGKKSMIVHVPVTDEGSGVEKISYTLTPRNADGGLDGSSAETKTAAVKVGGGVEITFDVDFRGTIAIGCTDRAGNAADSVTIGTAGAGGVIVEDTAPEITADVRAEYYDTAEDIHVTVKDDTKNAITAGIATVTYQVGNDTTKSVTFDTSVLQAEITFTVPASEISTGVTEIMCSATDNAGNEASKRFIVKVKGPEKKPAAAIDYREEKLKNLVPGEKYAIDGTEYTADGEGCIPIAEGWFDSTLSIIKKGSGSETTDSPAQSLPIPARPAKPTPTGADVTTPGGTGKLTGLTANVTYEISTDGGKTWVSETANGSGEITGLAPGTYVVRVKAGAANFASENSDSAKINAYKVKVTFMANGEKYQEITLDYGTDLTDVPAVPPKKDAGDQTYTGRWCSDEQGTPAVFTDITADMTVYAVYTKVYAVTMQRGTGYTLSAETGSESPVKEGESFTFRFALSKGYQKTAGFAVKVNGVKVELTAAEPYTYTIADIRENKTVTVEGVAKKPEKPSDPGGDKDEEDDPEPEESTPDTGDQTPGNPTPRPPVNPPDTPKPPAPDTASMTDKGPEGRPESIPAAEKEPEDRPVTTPKQEEAGKPEEESGAGGEKAGMPEADSADDRTQVPDATDSGKLSDGTKIQTAEVKIGNGKVIVTVVCEEEKCTAVVADTEAVVKAVLTPGRQEIVNSGETIEIRVDVTDISEKVPAQDKEVIERGIEAYREEVPGLVLGMYVDISMFIKIGDGDWNAITETDAPIEVVVSIPEKLLGGGREYYIIRAHNGEYTFMNDLDDVPDTITISTDLFSSYAIAYVETESTDTDAECGLCHICPTFLGLCYFIWLAVILAVILIVILVVWRRRKEEAEEQS